MRASRKVIENSLLGCSARSDTRLVLFFEAIYLDVLFGACVTCISYRVLLSSWLHTGCSVCIPSQVMCHNRSLFLDFNLLSILNVDKPTSLVLLHLNTSLVIACVQRLVETTIVLFLALNLNRSSTIHHIDWSLLCCP